MKGRVMLRNIPGEVRAIDRGDGVCELMKDPDVLTIMPKKQNKMIRKLVMTLGTAGIIAGLAAAVILAAPAFGVFFFALISWVLFAAWATGE